MTITKLTNFEPNTKSLHLRLIDSPQCTRPYDAYFAQTLYACSSEPYKFMYVQWRGIDRERVCVQEKRKRENERESKTECLCVVSHNVRMLHVCLYNHEKLKAYVHNDSTARTHGQTCVHIHTRSPCDTQTH